MRLIEPAGRTPPAPGIGDFAPTSLDAPELYLNRELTYLNFCWRVLHEAEDERIPLLERVKFLAIVSSNLDEFFQKRIGGLKQQVGAQLHALTPDGRTPQQQIDDCLELITRLEARKAQIAERVVAELKAVGVWIAPYKELDPTQQRVGARVLPAQHLPAGHAAGDGPGAPVPVRLEPVAEPAGLAALRERLASRCSRASRSRSAAACRGSCGSAARARLSISPT